MTTHPFQPYSVAMITPFSQQGAVDQASVRQMVNYYTYNQVPALLVSGSTGEQHSLTLEERIFLYQSVKDAAPGSMPLYAGVATVRTRDAVRLAREAEQTGLSAIMLGFPPYVRPNQREAALYVQEVCSATSLPLMLYNNPLRTGFNLEMETLFRLVKEFPQIIALKEAGNPDRIKEIKAELGTDFQVLSGFDLAIADYFDKGYDGLTSVAGNLFPLEFLKIIQLLREGNSVQAHHELGKLRESLELLGSIGWIRVIRHLFASHGIAAGYFREPLSPLTTEEQTAVQGIRLST
ncbi:dihydrodipicolinate synthase family protein [Paenibacillus sp. Soil522]|uniref:dihydrodipicolinate synthase family protein n=1 Tax=Paenibacillus sp. Soil522 TaxID=1736388 RepID=UPI000A9FEB3E|nr:dihydrodipicolinate synthase family protein [Paenibacillus sp. Soil522]